MVAGLVCSMSAAHAHKGHGGQNIHVMKHKHALRLMLPKAAKRTKYKQRLHEDSRDWVSKHYAVELDTTLKTYYLARDRATGRIVGSAMTVKFAYRHGEVMIGIGLDNNLMVTAAVLLSAHEKYLIDFEGTVGTGQLEGFTGNSIKVLLDKAAASADSVRPVRMIHEQLLEAAVTLAAFMRAAE